MVYVVNTYGYGSYGDDCSVPTLRNHLAAIWPSSNIVINRTDRIPFSPDKNEALVVGGGGLLYQHIDDDAAGSLKYFLRYPAAIQAFGKKTFAVGLGVQGGINANNLRPYVDVLDRMNLRTVRDSHSAEVLRDAGVSAPIVESADLAYLIELPERQARPGGRKPVLGVAASQPDKGVIYPESQGFEQRLLEALQQLDAAFDIRFYLFDNRTDRAIPDELGGRYPVFSYEAAGPEAIGRFSAAIGESDIFVTSRLHGVILCARMGIPFVSIGAPGEKVERESRALQHSMHLGYSSGADQFAGALRDAWSDRVKIQNTLKTAAAGRERLAQKTIEALHACN